MHLKKKLITLATHWTSKGLAAEHWKEGKSHKVFSRTLEVHKVIRNPQEEGKSPLTVN